MIAREAPPHRWHAAVSFLGYLGLAVQFAIVLALPARYQWDFRSYYYAVQLWERGANPYDFAALRGLAEAAGLHDGNLHPYLYPLHPLVLFSPLGQLGYHGAYYLFAALKLAAVVAFLALARRWVRAGWWRAAMPVFACLFFSGALPADLRNGNVALFETVVLFAAFGAALAGSRRRFAVLTVLASSAKLALLPFAAVPIFVRMSRPWRLTLAVGSVVPAMLLVGWLLAPRLSRDFLAAGGGVLLGLGNRAERGPLNASSWRLLADLSTLLFGRAEPWFLAVGFTVVASVVVGAIAVAWRAFDAAADRRGVLILLLLGYGLLLPRLTLYSYTLLIIPCVVVLAGLARQRLAWSVAVLACLPVYHLGRAWFGFDPQADPGQVWTLPIEYASLATVVFCWVAHIASRPRGGVLGQSRVDSSDDAVRVPAVPALGATADNDVAADSDLRR